MNAGDSFNIRITRAINGYVLASGGTVVGAVSNTFVVVKDGEDLGQAITAFIVSERLCPSDSAEGMENALDKMQMEMARAKMVTSQQQNYIASNPISGGSITNALAPGNIWSKSQ